MHVEILTIGSELTRGDIPDTNATHIAQTLFSLGYEVKRQVSIPDELDLIVRTLKECTKRSDAMVVTGGLGPTADDLTAEAAALAANVPLEEKEEITQTIEKFFHKLGRKMAPNNRKQAFVPKGATVVISPVGTAPAFAVEIGDCRAWFTAGVPREMRYLLKKHVIPDLLQAKPPKRLVRSVRIRCFQLAESRLDQMIKGLFDTIPDLEVGFKTEWPENVLLLFARGTKEDEVAKRLEQAKTKALEKLGNSVVALDKDTTLSQLGRRLEKQTLAIVESFTGGYASKLLTENPFCEDILTASVVLHSSKSQSKWLAPSEEQNAKQTACALAKEVQKRFFATYGLAITAETPDAPDDRYKRGVNSTIYIAVATPETVFARNIIISGDQEQQRRRATFEMFYFLSRKI